MRAALRAQDINVSTTTPNETRLDMEVRGLDGLVRASVHSYNTDEERDRLCDVLRAIALPH